MLKKLFIIICLFIVAALFYYCFYFEPYNIKIEKQVISIKNLPLSFDGLKIVQLSDFHSLKFGRREGKVIEFTEKLAPHFIFITGDFVLVKTDLGATKKFWQELGKKYQGRLFAVLGNHDHWYRDLSAIKKGLAQSKIKLLNNENIKLEREEEYIYLIGVDDPDTYHDRLAKAMQGVEQEVPKILLAHSPDIIEKAVKQKIDLVLVGHTHAGQVQLPFIGPLWVPSRQGRKYAQGFFRVGETQMYVNRGLGTSFLPIRFMARPEITLITLKKAN